MRPAGRRGRRRPAAAEDPAHGVESPGSRWDRGATMPLSEVPLEKLGQGTGVVVEDGPYFGTQCQVAGIVDKVGIVGGDVHVHIRVTGTMKEAILKRHTGDPGLLLRLHRCPADCAGEAASEDLVHAKQVRVMGEKATETGWVHNLEKQPVVDVPDDLDQLRERGNALVPRDPGAKAAAKKAKSGSDEEDDKGKKKKKKSKSKKKAKDKDKKEKKDDQDSSDDVKMDGSMARAASQKELKVLYRGTGLDPRDSVRRRVARLARKRLRRKNAKDGSSSESSSGSISSEDQAEVGDQLFDQSSRVKAVAESYPGALTAQAVLQMKAALLQEVGESESSSSLKPVATMYCRQQVLRRATPPGQRELLTLSVALDHLLRGRPCCAADTITQRLKSAESTINGTHWAVSQKMELVAADTTQLAGLEEVQQAQRDRSYESKTTYLSALPDGRSKLGKGNNKGKEEKGDWRREDRGRKGKSGGKGDKNPRKDDNATK